MDEGKYPVYSANVFEPFGYKDETNISDTSKDSIIWGIDGDWMVNVISKIIHFMLLIIVECYK